MTSLVSLSNNGVTDPKAWNQERYNLARWHQDGEFHLLVINHEFVHQHPLPNICDALLRLQYHLRNVFLDRESETQVQLHIISVEMNPDIMMICHFCSRTRDVYRVFQNGPNTGPRDPLPPTRDALLPDDYTSLTCMDWTRSLRYKLIHSGA